ncbi:collagen-binding domain-containing protein [Polaribacter sp. M15]
MNIFSSNAQCVSATDCDGDGIQNAIDLDDDNDGILDCVENGLNNNSLSDLFTIAGDATFVNSNEIELTPDVNNQAGSSMSFGKVDFTSDFNFSIEINLGTKDIGADGIAIVFHTDPDGIHTVGINGQGIGAKHIKNGISIEFDTYSNYGELVNDHTQIKSTSTWQGLTSATDLGNIEDGNWHLVNFSWVASTKTLSYSFDGTQITNYTDDLIANVFNGETNAHFGFTASTGGQRNSQRIRFVNELCTYPFAKDADNDAIPNQFDTDSDNDGCPDALEGSHNFTVTDANGRLKGGVNANGIPLVAVGISQTIGTSLDDTILAQVCTNPYSPITPAECFTVFVEHDVTLSQGTTNGSLAAGGDVTINGDYELALQDCGCYQVNGNALGLLVDGKVNYNTGILNLRNATQYAQIGHANGSNAWYADPQNAPTPIRITPENDYQASSYIQLAGNANAFNASVNPVFAKNKLDFPLAFQRLRTNATSLSENNHNALLKDVAGDSIANTNLPNQIGITLKNGANYININGSDLNNVQTINFLNTANSDKFLIVNVNAPGQFYWNVWSQTAIANASAPYIIYNFYNTTALHLEGNNTVYGSILAPFASITKNQNTADVVGQIIATSYTQSGGVVHCTTFAPDVNASIAVNAVPKAAFTVNDNACLTDNRFTFNNTSNTGNIAQPVTPIAYQWNFGDGTTSTAMQPTKTYTAAGVYTVTLTATNAFGSDTTTQQVTVLPKVAAEVVVNTTHLTDASVNANVTLVNGAEFSSYSWILPGQNTASYPNENAISLNFTQPGLYTLLFNGVQTNGCNVTTTIPITIQSNEVSTGNSGGVESESLGDAISKIYVGRKKNSVPTQFVKSKANLYNKAQLKSVQPYQGKGLTLLDMFPNELVAGNVANITSPTDILDYTIADEVFSVDFSVDGQTKGVVLGIKTSDKVYNHTKASCDRLRGAEILNITTVQLQGKNFLMQAIKQRTGVVEYAISFAVAKNNNDTNYTLQTNWYVNHYTKFNDVYNFQVWSTNPTDTQKLVTDVLQNLQSYMPIQQIEVQKVPKTYAAKIAREQAELVVLLRSTMVGQEVEIAMEEVYSETANNVKHRYNPVNSEKEKTIRINIADGYEYDALVKVNGEIEDAFYHADGNWGLDYDKRYTKINHYFVSNDFDRTYNDDEYAISRNVELQATSDYDYLTLYKSLLPGTLAADYSAYKYLSFTATGSGLLELGLIKSSIEEWKAQYRVMVDLSEEEQTYYVPFEIFTSIGTTAPITADDLTTLAFTFLPVEAQTTDLNLSIKDIKFTKTAVEEELVHKIEAFDNHFMAYPNPSQGNVNLLLYSNTPTEAKVSLFDVTGKTIYVTSASLLEGKNELNFDFANVKPGVLFLKVSSSETDYGTSKIIFK